MSRILIVEDETVLADAMADGLRAAGYTARTVYAGEKALAAFREFVPDIVLLDVRLGAVSGLDLLPVFKADSPELPVIILTAYGSVEVAVEAMKRGASEFLTKPVDLDVLAVTVEKVLATSAAKRRLGQFEAAQQERLRHTQLVGQCPAILQIQELVDRLAARSAASDAAPATILLTGETGTGKDLLATVLHSRLGRHDGPFVSVNCAAVPGELFESELFGHKRGAFSGATADKAGLFETADDGTLMLDEIADLPLGLQPKLLRAIETQTVRRVGETRDRPVSLCVIAATNRNLERAVTERRFREDLYFRLKVVTIELPPLRERGGDVDLLVDHFCGMLSAKYGIQGLRLSADAREAVRRYRWPGNVRELANAMERAVLVGTGPVIGVADLPLAAEAGRSVSTGPADRMLAGLSAGRAISLEDLERTVLEQALRQTGGNVSAAARLLSIGREAMRYRMGKFGLVSDPELDRPPISGS